MEENKSTKQEVRTIKRGNEDIDLDRYINNLEYNFDSWLNKVKWHGKKFDESQKKAITEAYRDMLNGYNDGTITPSLGNISTDSTGKRTNNPDKKGFDAYGLAQTYFNSIFNNQQAYVKPTKAKFSGNKAWNDYLNSQTIDYDLFKQMSKDEQNQYLQNLLQNYTGNIKGDDYEDYDSNYGQNVMNLFNQAISDPELTAKERMDLSQYGIDLSKFYKVEEPEPEKTEEDLLNEELAKQQKEEELDDKKMQVRAYNWKKELEALNNLYSIRDYSRVGDYRRDLSKLKIDDETYQKILNPDRINRANIFADYSTSDNLYNGNVDNRFTTRPFSLTVGDKKYGYLNDEWNNLSNADKVLAIQKAYGLDWIGNLSEDQRNNRTIKNSKSSKYNGWYVVDTDFNNSGYVTVMSKDANKIGRIPVAEILSTNNIDDYLGNYVRYHLSKKNIPINKEGGILKAQFGDTIFETTDTKQNINNLNKEKTERKERDLIKRAKETGRTLEQYKRDKTKVKEDLSGTDIARWTAMAADLASLGLSASGVGSVAGGLVGAAGTFTNMGADIAEGRSVGEVLKNLGIGLGLDLVGSIPVAGVLAKAPKIVKTFRTLAKSSPYVLGALSTIGNKDVTDSVGKILKGEDWTHEDLKNLSYFVSFLTGTARGGIASGQKRLAKKYANQSTVESQSLITDKGTIKVGNKEGEIKQGDFNKLKETKNLKEAQQILKDLKIKGFEDASLKGSTKIPFIDQKVNKSNFVDEKSTVYDTSNLEGVWWLRNNNDRLSIENQLNGKGWSGGFMDKLFAPKNQQINSNTSSTLGPISSILPLSPVTQVPSIKLSSVLAKYYPKPSSPIRTRNNGVGVTRQNLSNLSGINKSILDAGITDISTPTGRRMAQLSNGVRVIDLRNYFRIDSKGRLKPKNKTVINELNWATGTYDRANKKWNKGDWNLQRWDKSNLQYILNHSGFDAIFGPRNINNAVLSKNGKTIYWWKQGGSIQKAKDILSNLKKNNNILKGQNGITPQWFDDLFKNQTILKYKGQDISKTNMPNASSRNTMGVSGYNGYGEHIYDNKARYDALEAYKNSGNRDKDIQNYFTKYVTNASSMTDQQLIDNYNAKAKRIRDFWNGNVDYNNTNASTHNDIHRELFESRNLEKGDPNTGNVGWDEINKARAGRSTWARIMDVSENDDLNNIYNINVGNGRILKVYKKANGDLGLFNETNLAPQNSSNPNSQNLDASKVEGVGDVDTSGDNNLQELLDQYKLRSSVNRMSGLPVLGGTLATNNSIYNTMNNSMTGYNIIAPQEQGRTLGDKFGSNFYRNQGLDVLNRAKLNFTSDAALNFAIQAEAQKMKIGLDEKGMLGDNQEIRRTSENEQNIENRNTSARVDARNKNAALNYDTRRTRAQLLADLKLKQWNAIAGWINEQRGFAQQDLANQYDFIKNAMYHNAQQRLDNATYAAKEKLRQAIRANQNNPTWDMYDSPEYQEYARISREVSQQIQLEQMRNQGNLFGVNYTYEPGFQYNNK